MSTKKQTTKAKSLPGGDSATYVTRPKGKPSVTTMPTGPNEDCARPRAAETIPPPTIDMALTHA